MISPKLRNEIKELWALFWSSGMSNPLTAIEQITYLLFLKRLEELDRDRVDNGKRSIYGRRPNCTLEHHPDDSHGDDSIPEGAAPKQYVDCPGHHTARWSYISEAGDIADPRDPDGEAVITPHDLLSKYVFPWLRQIERTLEDTSNAENGIQATAARMDDAYFQLPREKEATLQQALSKVNRLFHAVSGRGVNADIMGDTFEYLLSEIQTSGKNGQFRTPRHIIRFMVELLNPEKGERIVDPAAGTGGFLIGSVQHLLKNDTPAENVRIEWDGEPHDITGGVDTHKFISRDYFSGFDNDRTMVRIGWMNLILHGIEDPDFERRDTLGKGLPANVSNAYRVALANPPFKGNVDTGDLHPSRFPKSGKSVITNKTQLLFIWLLLDLLEPGGRAAVIVPDGVLFGGGRAERELRRQLLFEHDLDGVISLPAGVFNPYAGVKTSILIFRKFGQELAMGEMPRTESVWFYDITSDGYTTNAQRTAQPLEDCDLWDALAKFPDRIVDSRDYWRPEVTRHRWRVVETPLPELFPHLQTEEGRARGIDERHPGMDADPDKATAHVVAEQTPRIEELFRRWIATEAPFKRKADIKKRAAKLATLFNGCERDLLERDTDEFARKEIRPIVKAARETTQAEAEARHADKQAYGALPKPVTDEEATEIVRSIVTEFVKLDGYDVFLRTPEVTCHKNYLKESRSWSVPVRVFAETPEWESEDGSIKGSHDDKCNIRPEFLADPRIYDDGAKNLVNPDYLDPTCIEASALNLSAARYQPFTFETEIDAKPADVLRDIQGIETKIQERLAKLLEMVEGRA